MRVIVVYCTVLRLMNLSETSLSIKTNNLPTRQVKQPTLLGFQ